MTKLTIDNRIIDLVVEDVTIHPSHSGRVGAYVKIKLGGEAPMTNIFAYASGLFGPGGKILLQCGIIIDDIISGEAGERVNIADRCIGKTVRVRLGLHKWEDAEQVVVEEVL